MKVADLDLFAETFHYVAEDGTQTTYAVKALNEYIDAHPELEKFKIDIDAVHVHRFVSNNEVEIGRIERLMAEPERLVRAIVFVEQPNGEHILVDGRHRYTAFFKLRAPVILAYVLPWELGKQFIVEDFPHMPEEMIYGYSYVTETRELQKRLRGED